MCINTFFALGYKPVIKTAKMPKSTYTVKEVAKLLSFSTNTVYKYLENGSIKAVRFGAEGRFRIPASEVERLLQERGKSLQETASYSVAETQNPPSVFDWFIGFLSMSLGFSQFVNPSYTFAQESLAKFVPYINIISIFLFVGGVLLLGFDVFNFRRDHRHTLLNLFMGILYLVLGGIFLSQEIIFSVGYLSISVVLIASVFKKMDYYLRYIIFVNLLFFLIGLGFLIWPSSITFCDLCIKTIQKNLFAAIWIVGFCIFSFLSFRALKRNKRFIRITAFLVGTTSLLYAVASFTNGFWGRAIFGIVLGTFSFIFPFADEFDSFKAKTKRESVVSFLWLLGVFIIGSLVLQTVYHSFQKIILDEMGKRVEVASSITKNFMDAKISVLSAFLDDKDLPTLLANGKPNGTLDAKLKQIYLSSNNSFVRVVVTDKTGTIIDTYPFYLQSQNLNISERDYFKVPAETGKVFITDLVKPKSQGIGPSVLISFPITDDNGKFLGILLGSIDTSELQKRLETLNSDDIGSFSVTDSKGNYILNPDPQDVVAIAPPGSFSMKALSGESGAEIAYGRDGVLKFAAYDKIDTYGWGIVASQPLSSALKMYSLMSFAAFLFFIMATVGSVTLVMFLRKNK